MRNSKSLLVVPVLAAVAAACASTVPVSSTQQTATVSAPSQPRWISTLNAVQERTGDVRQVAVNRARGSFTMVEGERSGWSKVSLSFSANEPGSGSASLAWALLPGPCGADVQPVLPISAFPMLDLGGAGTGRLDTQIHFDFPITGAYHVNVYRATDVMGASARSIAGVVSCGNLKFQQ